MTVILSVFIVCVLCICGFLYKKTSAARAVSRTRRSTGEIMFNTVYTEGNDVAEYNNDFRKRLQSINPIRLDTPLSSVVPPEQENITKSKIMRILFQDVEEGFQEEGLSEEDGAYLKESEVLNEDFIYDEDEMSPNPKNSMRYISSYPEPDPDPEK